MKTLPGYTQEIFADDAVAFLRSRGAKKAPFLLWLAFTAPHTPLTPNPPRIEALYAEKSGAALKPPGFTAPAEADWRHYDEAVSSLDEQIGRVLAALDQAGLAKTTAVVFLGDNGFMMGQRGIGAKGPNGKVVPYEGSLRVPLIVRAPGSLAGRLRSRGVEPRPAADAPRLRRTPAARLLARTKPAAGPPPRARSAADRRRLLRVGRRPGGEVRQAGPPPRPYAARQADRLGRGREEGRALRPRRGPGGREEPDRRSRGAAAAQRPDGPPAHLVGEDGGPGPELAEGQGRSLIVTVN